MYKQIIIARKDLNMSPGKLAAQVSHGSMAFMTNMIRKNTTCIVSNFYPAWQVKPSGEQQGVPQYYKRADLHEWAKQARNNGDLGFFAEPQNEKNPFGPLRLCEKKSYYQAAFPVDRDLYEQWINGEFTKCVLRAKNKNDLMKAKKLAEEMGMEERKDFWLIRDNCHTELEPEENGTTLTVIGFRPMDSEIIDQIGKKYRLYT